MNCHVCGHLQTDPQAAFCGQCGVALAKLAEVDPPSDVDTLAGALLRLADLLEERDFLHPQLILELRAWARVEPMTDRAAIVILGDSRRGKSTLINRLIGQEVIATKRNAEPRTIRVGRFPANAQADDAELISCQAAILQAFDLVDTPPLCRAEGNEVSAAVRQALSANAIVICIDARQPLSMTERDILELELLPLTRCPILLAMTFLDQVPDPADQEEVRGLVSRYVARETWDRVSLMMLSPGRAASDSLPELEAWIDELAASQPHEPTHPEARLSELLTWIECSIPDSEEPRRDVAREQCALAVSVLEREHRVALGQATSVFREGCSRLRGNLKAVIRAGNTRTSCREGMALVVHGLRQAVEHSAGTYLSTLRSALQADGPLVLQTQSDAINLAGMPALKPADISAPVFRVASRRNWRASGLEAAALATAVVMPGWISAVGAGIALVAAGNWRQGDQLRTESDFTLETESVLQDWLTKVEPALIQEFQKSTEATIDQIRAQVVQCFRPENTASPEAQSCPDIRRALAHCRELMEGKRG
jgi:GTP-binding protein EngB required for normal cell division